jgi:hypothetical protein
MRIRRVDINNFRGIQVHVMEAGEGADLRCTHQSGRLNEDHTQAPRVHPRRSRLLGDKDY